MIKDESIEKLKSQIDIVDIIERYIPLKRSGRNFICLCPFHDDRNPSMSVSPEMGIFHCFSCKAGGDAIKFVMDYEKLNYVEAIEKIASMTNFILEYSDRQNIEKKPDKQILQKLNAYYQSFLFQTPEAINYLRQRGLDDETIMKFGLGYAPSSSYTLRLLENEEIPPDEALNAGVVKQNENGFYASFAMRITFPINNHVGKIVGFGGRTITDHAAKYVNSPQSALFDKSKILYAYDIAKKSAFDKKKLIITEGYMDTIMLHKAGFTNVVAVLGTALTEKHLSLLRRGDLQVILSFDGDEAGINAAIKSAKLLTANGIDTSVAIIEGGQDPADMISNGQIQKLKEIYLNAMEGGEFVIRSIFKNYDLNRPLQKQKALEEVQKYTSTLKPIVAESYRGVVEQILRIKSKFSLGANAVSTPAKNQNKFSKTTIQKQKDYLELGILKSFISNKKLFIDCFDICSSEIFTTHRQIYTILLKDERNNDEETLLRELLLDESVNKIDDEKMIFGAIKILKERHYNQMIEDIKFSDDPDKFIKIKKLRTAIENLRAKI